MRHWLSTAASLVVGADRKTPAQVRSYHIALVFFFLYFFSFDLNGVNSHRWNFIFDADINRMELELGGRISQRHPLVPFVLGPISSAANLLGFERSAILPVALLSSLAMALAYRLLRRRLANQIDALLFTLLFGVSSSVWLTSAIPETYAVNNLAIVLAFYFSDPRFAMPREHFRRFFSYLVYTAVATGITLTNVAYPVLGFVNCVRQTDTTHARRALTVIVYLMACSPVLATVGLLLAGPPSGTGQAAQPGIIEELRSKRFLRFDRDVDAIDLTTHARSFLIDSVVAPRVLVEVASTEEGYQQLIQFGSRRRGSYLLTLGALTVLLVTCIATIRKPAAFHQDQHAPLAVVLIGMNLGFYFFFRGKTQPFIQTIHTVFPLIILLSTSYRCSRARHKRTLLIAVSIAVLSTNLVFINEINSIVRLQCDEADFKRGIKWICLKWTGIDERTVRRYSVGVSEYMRELDQPDLWEDLAKFQLPEAARLLADISNEAFTARQVDVIGEALKRVRAYLDSEVNLAPEHRVLVHDRLDYLVAAAKRQGRRDWLHTCLGVIVTIATAAGLAPNEVRAIWVIVKTSLSSVIPLIGP